MSSDLCSDKIEANIAIQIKFSPKTGQWYVKSVKMAHEEFVTPLS